MRSTSSSAVVARSALIAARAWRMSPAANRRSRTSFRSRFGRSRASDQGTRAGADVGPCAHRLRHMATTLDGWVSEARLQELLARQGETFDLDYKSVLDIQNDLRHRLKLVKLVAAMTALGGDILVGADGRGKPTGMVTQALAQVYDEASLRLILRGYLPPELRIHSQTHVVDGKEVIVVRVEAAAGGPVALTKDGVYRDANNQPVYEFSAGERYIRDGTRNSLFVGDAHQHGLLLFQLTVAPPATAPA